MRPCLVLEDSTVLAGRLGAIMTWRSARLVFATSMTGYFRRSSPTPPSPASWSTFTQPMIGNYGVRRRASRSAQPARGRRSSARAGNAAPCRARGVLRLAGRARRRRPARASMRGCCRRPPARRRHRCAPPFPPASAGAAGGASRSFARPATRWPGRRWPAGSPCPTRACLPWRWRPSAPTSRFSTTASSRSIVRLARAGTERG